MKLPGPSYALPRPVQPVSHQQQADATLSARRPVTQLAATTADNAQPVPTIRESLTDRRRELTACADRGDVILSGNLQRCSLSDAPAPAPQAKDAANAASVVSPSAQRHADNAGGISEGVAAYRQAQGQIGQNRRRNSSAPPRQDQASTVFWHHKRSTVAHRVSA